MSVEEKKKRARGFLTDKANIGDVVDDGPAINLRQRRKEHGPSRKSQHINRHTERTQLFIGTAKLLH